MLMQVVSFGILVYAFALFVVPWLTTFEAARVDIMLAVFALQISMGAISPFAGRMLDRYASSWLVPLGGLLLAAGLALVSFATHWWQITLLYATLLPAAATLTGPLAAQTIITKWFRERRGLAIGISAIGTSIGGFLIPLLCGVLLAAYDWRTTTQFLALMALLLICPFAWLVLRRSPPVAPVHSSSAAGHAAPSPEMRIWTTREILNSRDFWIPVMAFLPLGMAFSGVQFNLAAYAQDLGNSLSDSAWLISLLSLSMIIGKLFFGFMADRVDHRKLYWIAAAFMCITLILLQGKPAYAMLCAGSIMMGLSIGGWLRRGPTHCGSGF
jgi:MFS family permease